MNVSVVQLASPRHEGAEARRERVGQMLGDAKGSDLVVLPELRVPGYFAFDLYEECAEPLDGDTVSAGREWARRLSCYVHLGSMVERSGKSMYNTAVLLDPDGEVLLTYRKAHLFHHQSREAELLSAGDSIGMTKTPLGNLATSICYDLRFPELWRTLVEASAETVIVPSAWPLARRDHWQLLTSCRALEQQILLLGCNAVGVQSDVVLAGASRVVDPWGVVLAEASNEEEVLRCEVSISIVGAARAELPVLQDRLDGGPIRLSAFAGEAEERSDFAVSD